MASPKVFFDMTVGGSLTGQIVMKLLTALQKLQIPFSALFTGEKGTGRSGKLLHFGWSLFRRVILNFMCKGGDFTKGKGTGGESIYYNKFAEKNFVKRHTDPGILHVANICPSTNGMYIVKAIKKVGATSKPVGCFLAVRNRSILQIIWLWLKDRVFFRHYVMIYGVILVCSWCEPDFTEIARIDANSVLDRDVPNRNSLTIVNAPVRRFGTTVWVGMVRRKITPIIMLRYADLVRIVRRVNRLVRRHIIPAIVSQKE
ncbi:hypothetical protein E3N88_16956 [Mikania micrantha]|uniref:Peptidyl-prolyl cis-trans isomerase n=1 Tax=Mikania micrantha TaxID=192012 RepID=A0A5N6NRZ5_9ASTR|nr:hypothetical protein E3N88_16956 [Mikania micrantha]